MLSAGLRYGRMSDSAIQARGREQVAAIANLGAALDARGLDHWLFGGWAVDFHVGAVTRLHDDIDIVAWRDDAEVLGATLEAAGWLHTPTENDLVGTRYRLATVDVELTFVISDAAGQVIVPLAEGPVVWSATPFGDQRRELFGVTARTIPLSLLRAGKSFPREGEWERAKDLADFATLSQLDDE